MIPFKNNTPGKDWIKSFLDRNGLTLKKGGMMQLARKSVTSDPFIEYGFYYTPEAIIADKELAERPDCIFNMDESGSGRQVVECLSGAHKVCSSNPGDG